MIKTVFQPHHIEYMSGQTFWIKMTYKFTMRHSSTFLEDGVTGLEKVYLI